MNSNLEPLPLNIIKATLNKYFNFNLESTDPKAVPTLDKLQELHEELAVIYRRQAAESMWLEVGAERNPEPLILARYRSYLPEGTETEYEAFYIHRQDADILISSYQGEVYEWSKHKTVLRFAEIQLSRVPESVKIERHYDFKEYLIDKCIIEG